MASNRLRHALVGGWSQRRGDFVSLLLGVRQGRRRKLSYIGEVKTNPDDLATNLLEPLLRESEVESSPFIDGVPTQSGRAHHWVHPDLVAEIEFDGWTTAKTVKRAALKAVTERQAFRRANWITVPKT